jgi:hypothetical protein
VKQNATLFIMCLFLGWLIACANTPNPAEAVPTAEAPATSHRAVTTTPQDETGSLQETVEVGDVRFAPHSITVESSGSVAVAASDFDGDGRLDLVISGEPQLTIFRGDGEGGVISFSRVPGGEQPVDFALADLDEDGDVDIVVANHDTDYLTILLGDGHGVFQPAPDSPLRIDVSPHPHAVRAADLDADGHVDLVVDHREAQGLLILRGLGTGRFESPGTLVEVGGDPYRGMAVGDIDGDGRLDLVTPNPKEVGVLFNASSGRLAFEQASSVAAQAPFAVEVGDFDGDDRLDLIAASDEGSPLVELFLGDGNGEFKEANDSPFRLAPGGKNIAVGDFNGDGIEDAAVACWQSSDVLVLLGGRGSIRTGTLPGGEHPWGLATADLNGDRKDDLVIADDAAPKAMIYLSLDQ